MTPVPAASSPPVAQASKEFVDVCGVGRVKREGGNENDPSAWLKALEPYAANALPDMVRRLDTGTPSQRMAAALLRDDVQAAAQLAISVSDAATYNMALRACRRDAALRVGLATQKAWMAASAASGTHVELPVLKPEPTACAMLGIDRLEALAPTDALPWLIRLNDSLNRADSAAVAQALYEIVQRPRMAIQPRAISAAVLEVVDSEPSLSDAFALMQASALDMSSGLESSAGSVGRACRAEALRDANRRQLCEQATRRLSGIASNTFDAVMLYSLEERLGLPHSPLALSRDDLNRAQSVMSEDIMRWMEDPSCANVAGMGRQVAALVRDGELAVVRAKLKTLPASAPR